MATRPKKRAPAVESRWEWLPPTQGRSRKTIDRFGEATEALLREQPFEQITVQDIVKAAGRPVGSFYARFATKEALLPFLYQRYHDGLEDLYASRFGRIDWNGIELEEATAEVVDLLLGLYTERRWLLRALALFARAHPEALPADLLEQRRRVFEMPVDALLRHRGRIRHADPAAAIRFGIFLVSSVARDKLLFGEAPHARVTPMARGALRDELIRSLFGYLTSEAPR